MSLDTLQGAARVGSVEPCGPGRRVDPPAKKNAPGAARAHRRVVSASGLVMSWCFEGTAQFLPGYASLAT